MIYNEIYTGNCATENVWLKRYNDFGNGKDVVMTHYLQANIFIQVETSNE